MERNLKEMVIYNPMKYLKLFSLAALFIVTGAVAQSSNDGAEAVNFPAEYFNKFKPLTALEMVQQVPGFQLDEGSTDTRGFANAAGNLLINDRRPSAKQDLPTAILSRIPAGNVERIELIRGQVRDIDLRGQSAMINVITHDEKPAAVRWATDFQIPIQHGPITPSIYASFSDAWNGLEYNAGFEVYKQAYGRDGIDQRFDGADMLTENRFDNRENRNTTYKGNLSTASWLGETLLKFNGVYSYGSRDQELFSNRVPQAVGADPRDEIFIEDVGTPTIEIGVDAERNLKSDLLGKAIVLFYKSDADTLKTQEVIDGDGNRTSFRVADSSADSLELITRLEFNWTYFQDHTLKSNMERAYNRLEGTLLQTLDTGAGPVTVEVPGANSMVKEERYDFLLQDIWSLGSLEFDFGLGGEASTITQTGDAEQKRNFFFIKPHAILTYAPEQSQQTRFRLAREVAQLNLTEFVSATVFEDDDLALGNPDLQPETTWVSELSHEQRFGKFSVVSVRLFHHWISDVQDLLPLTSSFEVPGNIGSGRRWGFEVESTLPVDWLGLAGSKLDIKFRLQDSTVTDPVTGEKRSLSSPGGDFPVLYNVENHYAFSVNYRQDFEVQRWAWGWNILTRAERPLYKVNELEIYNEAPQLNFFIETTRWYGIKMRVEGNNVLDAAGSRDRTVFVSERDLSAIRFHEVRDRERDAAVFVKFSGVF